jgi:hypothetical protein
MTLVYDSIIAVTKQTSGMCAVIINRNVYHFNEEATVKERGIIQFATYVKILPDRLSRPFRCIQFVLDLSNR